MHPWFWEFEETGQREGVRERFEGRRWTDRDTREGEMRLLMKSGFRLIESSPMKRETSFHDTKRPQRRSSDGVSLSHFLQVGVWNCLGVLGRDEQEARLARTIHPGLLLWTSLFSDDEVDEVIRCH